MNWLYYVYWAYTLIAATAVMLVSQSYVKYLQDNNYSLSAYSSWVKKNFRQDWLFMILVGVIGLMLKICNVFFVANIPVLAYICFYGADAIFLYLMFSLYLSYRKINKDQPPQIKGAALRMLIFIWIAAFLCEANMMRETEYYGSVTWLQYLLPYFIGYLPAMLLPLLSMLAFVITSPHLAFKKQEEGSSFYCEEDEIIIIEKNDVDNSSADTADAEDKGENK